MRDARGPGNRCALDLRARRTIGQRETAFTLLEVMLALTVFGIVLTAVYGTFSRTLRSKGIAEERVEITRSGRNAVARMAEELASAYYPEGGAPGAIFRSLPGGTEAVPLDSVVFSTLSVRPTTAAARESDQRVIGYFFPQRQRERDRARLPEDDTDDLEDFFAAFGRPQPPRAGASAERLLRREGPLTADALELAPATAFADNVASLRLRFSDGLEWVAGWDSEDTGNYRRLPRAVAIDFALYDVAGEVHHFATSVDLPLADTRPPRRASGAGATGAADPALRTRATAGRDGSASGASRTHGTTPGQGGIP